MSINKPISIVIALVAVALVGVTVYMFLLAHQQDVLCGLGIFHILWVILVFASCSQEREVPNLVRASEPGFTGLERCAACHTDKYAEWRQSLHSVAMTVPSDSAIVGDFDNVSHVYGGVRSRMFRRGDAYYMETEGEDGRTEDIPRGLRDWQAAASGLFDGFSQWAVAGVAAVSRWRDKWLG